MREGDKVEAGQMLLELDDTAARAELQRLFLRRIRLTAVDARLQAEMREDQDVPWPSDVVHWRASSPEVKEIVDSQQMAFTARRNNLNSDIKSIQDSINALEERIRGSRVQLEAVHRQIVLLDDEIVTKDKLVQAGLVRKPELLVLQRSKANLEGEVGRILGDIGDAKERIARAVEQINGARKTAIKTAVEQMHEVRGELADVRERMLSAKGVLDRIRVTAPVSGVVVKLRYHTQGGVVEPGKNIMLPGIAVMAALGAQIADLARNASWANAVLLALAILAWIALCLGVQFLVTWMAGRKP